MLTSWHRVPVRSACLDAARARPSAALCRRCDVTRARSAGSSIRAAATAAAAAAAAEPLPLGEPTTTSTTSSPALLDPQTWRTRYHSGGPQREGLFIYLFINLFTPPLLPTLPYPILPPPPPSSGQRWPGSMAAAAEEEAGAGSSTLLGMDPGPQAGPPHSPHTRDQTPSTGGEQ